MQQYSRWMVVVLVWMAASASAQEVILSRQEIIQKAQSSNLDLKIAEKDYQLKEADYLQSRAMYLPNVNVNYVGMSTNSPLMAFGTRLNQSVVTQQDFNPELLNDPDAIQNFSLQLQVEQPLVNLDKGHERAAAKHAMEAVTLQAERTSEYVAFLVAQLYMQLQLTYRSVTVIEQAIATAKVNQQHAQNAFEVGYLQEADLLEVEVRINELEHQLLDAKNQLQTLSDQLHFLMQDDGFAVIRPAEELILDVEPLPMEVVATRADFRAMDQAREAYSEMLEAEEKGILPRLNAFGTFETNDDSPIGFGANNYMVGAQISWNVFDGNQRSATIQRARTNLEKAQLEKQQYVNRSQVDFLKAIRMHDLAQSKYSSTQTALTAAEEVLRIRTNRLQQGLEKPSDVLIAEAKYAEQELLKYQAVFEINFAKLYAQFLSR